MELKITTLIENQPDDTGKLAYEHGLSLYIEFDGKRILFDTGQTGAFADNARKLGVDLSALSAVILSHGHYDHSGGVPRLLPLLTAGTPVYTGKGFFDLKYKRLDPALSGSENTLFQYNGNPFPPDIFCAYPVSLTQVDSPFLQLTSRIFLLGSFPRSTSFEQANPRFFVSSSSGFCQDDFPDELALGLLTEKGLVLVSGCAHPGIINMLHAAADRMKAPAYAVIGGTHLVEAGTERLEKTLEAFRDLGLSRIAVSHCTGRAGEECIRNTFPNQFIRNNTGCVFQL